MGGALCLQSVPGRHKGAPRQRRLYAVEYAVDLQGGGEERAGGALGSEGNRAQRVLVCGAVMCWWCLWWVGEEVEAGWQGGRHGLLARCSPQCTVSPHTHHGRHRHGRHCAAAAAAAGGCGLGLRPGSPRCAAFGGREGGGSWVEALLGCGALERFWQGGAGPRPGLRCRSRLSCWLQAALSWHGGWGGLVEVMEGWRPAASGSAAAKESWIEDQAIARVWWVVWRGSMLPRRVDGGAAMRAWGHRAGARQASAAQWWAGALGLAASMEGMGSRAAAGRAASAGVVKRGHILGQKPAI